MPGAGEMGQHALVVQQTPSSEGQPWCDGVPKNSNVLARPERAHPEKMPRNGRARGRGATSPAGPKTLHLGVGPAWKSP